jgi:hypothetical protein
MSAATSSLPDSPLPPDRSSLTNWPVVPIASALFGIGLGALGYHFLYAAKRQGEKQQGGREGRGAAAAPSAAAASASSAAAAAGVYTGRLKICNGILEVLKPYVSKNTFLFYPTVSFPPSSHPSLMRPLISSFLPSLFLCLNRRRSATPRSSASPLFLRRPAVRYMARPSF